MKRYLTFIFTLSILCILFAGISVRVEAATLTSSDKFIEMLKAREGFEKYPYKDNSQWSVGYGTKCPDDKLEYYKEHGITEKEAEQLMREMLNGFESSVLKFANKYKLTLTQNQFDALVSFSYNCGTAWLSDTNGNMNKAVREGWTGSDFLYAICLWSKSAGKYVLIDRRLDEANIYINGIYDNSYNHDKGSFRYIFLESGQAKTEYEIHGFDIRDPKPIRYKFTKTPTGKDANGNTFTYTFAGWYTAPVNGKKVEKLDSSLASGSLLYAMWKDPSGKIVHLPKGEACNVVVTVTKVNEFVTIRSGPGTQYSKLGELKKNSTVTITRIYDDNGSLWGQYEDGWIKLSYTNYDEVIAGDEVWPRTGVVTGNKVNVRSGPGTSNPMQYQLNKGDKVTIVEQTYVGSMYWGKLSDGNWISLDYVKFDEIPVVPDPEPEPEPEPKPEPEPVDPDPAADVDGNGIIDEDDAIFVLQHVLMPDVFQANQNLDFDSNAQVNEDDAVYLLQHILMPDQFPLNK